MKNIFNWFSNKKPILSPEVTKLTSELIELIFPDHKTRTPVAICHFGDIIIKEINNDGTSVYSILLIEYHNNTSKRDYHFHFKISIIALSEKRMLDFLNQSFNNQKSKEYILRYNLFDKATLEYGSLSNNEVYAYFGSNNYDISPKSQKLDIILYLQNIKAYIRNHPYAIKDVYPLNRLNEVTPPFINKLYYGYDHGKLDNTIYTCINLREFAVWNMVDPDLNSKIIQWENLNSLSISNLHVVDPEMLNIIHKLEFLTSLSITSSSKHYYKLEQIPPKLNKLRSLKELYLSGNIIKDWSEICKLKKIKILDLSNNQLENISANIKELKLLEELHLSNNKITQLPIELKELKNLKVLNINKNTIKELPDWIGELNNLESLDITQNQLDTLPESILQLNLKSLSIKKNKFKDLPQGFKKIKKRVLHLEERFKALYDDDVKAKIDKYPKGNCFFEKDFNFKLMIIQKLMYEDEVLLPKFDIWKFTETYTARKIDIEAEGYHKIPEAITYFKELAIPMELLIDITELNPDGGDEIHSQIIPFWDGEDNEFDVISIADIDYLPNLKRTNDMNFSKEIIKDLRQRKIKVSSY
ncbi:leucine-rich repeat domain-containing protein [Aquimarina muelleri]|uniref:DUF6892 domain-containing protein n=1 Tax=Aquimarina muelleri TaxID=279356 RepID=A0A918JRK6_9FLAO|nr:leucine-rich repeat domain-containing protein [Aquimarina muelleri]MCX2762640.1 leucine-rich repeat domain-containing protein [Aquimarina muelleri]GGX05848.1 hypothetical protein GCM10007384_04440 [Aquimarina muelleri]